jgi:hypothetical protein
MWAPETGSAEERRRSGSPALIGVASAQLRRTRRCTSRQELALQRGVGACGRWTRPGPLWCHRFGILRPPMRCGVGIRRLVANDADSTRSLQHAHWACRVWSVACGVHGRGRGWFHHWPAMARHPHCPNATQQQQKPRVNIKRKSREDLIAGTYVRMLVHPRPRCCPVTARARRSVMRNVTRHGTRGEMDGAAPTQPTSGRSR